MEPIEIIVIAVTIVVVGGVIGSYIYKKVKKLPTGECAYCHKKGDDLVRAYHKKYRSKK